MLSSDITLNGSIVFFVGRMIPDLDLKWQTIAATVYKSSLIPSQYDIITSPLTEIMIRRYFGALCEGGRALLPVEVLVE